jgi:hypothetical protein
MEREALAERDDDLKMEREALAERNGDLEMEREALAERRISGRQSADRRSRRS